MSDEVSIKHLLTNIADNLDGHIKNGQPYGLTFFYDERVPLTSEQKKILEAWLAHNFRDVWGNTWIKMEADAIRAISESITENRVVTTMSINEETLFSNEHIKYMYYK